MALAAGTIWECRQQATASNVNGGGFNPTNTGNSGGPGTDLSQSLTASYTFTDLATANGTNSTPTVTSVGHSFVGADCGNIIHINTTGTGGHFLTGLYEIVSVAAGGAVLDRACASTAAEVAGTYHVGGAMSLQTSAGFTDSLFFNSVVAGNMVYILGGAAHPTYTMTAQLNTTMAGTTTSNIAVEGYAVTRGDRPTGSTRPLLISSTTQNFLFNSDTNLTSLIFSSGVATGQAVNTPNRGLMLYCKFISTTTTANIPAVVTQFYSQFMNCEFVSYRGPGLSHINDLEIVNCYFHDSDIGILNGNNGSNYGIIYTNCIFESMVTAGIKYSNANTAGDIIEGCTFFGGITNKTGTGVLMVTGNAGKRCLNNIFYGLATGISCADASGTLQGSSMFSNWNDYFSNTADVSNITKGPQDVALNPSFQNVAQLTGTAGVVSGSTLVVSSAAGIVANQDFVYIVSGTGATAGQYLITNVSGTTLTLSSAPGGSGSNIVYQITTGRNFYAAGLANLGSLGTFPGGLTKGFQNIGAVQSTPTLASTFCG